MTLEQALEELHAIGYDDAVVTGGETPIPGSDETRIGYTTSHVFDHPILVRSVSGDYRIEPWTFRFPDDDEAQS